MALFEEYKKKFPAEADALYRMQHRQLPDGWDKDIRPSPRTPRAWPARRLAEGAERDRQERALADWRRGRLAPPPRPASRSRARATSRPRRPAGATSTSGSASTRWLDPERLDAVEDPALRLGLPDLQRLRRARSAGCDHGDPGHLHLHARLDRRREDGPTHQPVEQVLSLRAIPAS